MKTHSLLKSLLSVILLVSAGGARAENAGATPAKRELAIIVVETLQHRGGAITDFDRLDMAFNEVAEERKWPVTIKAERFAANNPTYETELRIFTQPVKEETRGDVTFRGWMTLTVNGKKHDFGMVTYRYYPRAGERSDDVLDKIFKGAANAGADKIEPILFPK